jgi:hypothetical protein
MMQRGPQHRLGLGLAVTVTLVAALGALPAGAATADGMLEAEDTRLTVVSKPHRSTVIAIDSVDAECVPIDGVERDARVVGFAAETKKRTSGARLNQVVYDFGSAGAAKSFFAEVRASDTQRVNCGSTNKASDFGLTKGPTGVGDARFTVISKEDVSGVTRRVASVQVLTGSSITELIFLDWDKSLPSTTAVAKAAVKRLRQ